MFYSHFFQWNTTPSFEIRAEVIGMRCHELRIVNSDVTWRIVYRTDDDAIVIAEVLAKKTRTTPKGVIDICKRRLKEYDDASR